MLKSFQRLGYFVLPEEVPPPFIVYLKKCLQFKDYLKPVISERTQRYYQEAIRSYLGVKPYSKQAQKIAAIAVARSAKVREYSADLINVAIEELVKERYELPAFSTLDRLIGHIKFRVNQRLYLKITASLSQSETLMLEQLVSPEAEANTLTLNLLKSLPKKANLAQIKALQNKFNQLMSFGDTKRLLADVPATKIKAWAAMAKASDIGELRDTNPAKRQVLLLCLLYQAQVKTRDHLVEMFLKRIKKIDNQAQQRLVELRDKHLAQTESLLEIFTEVLQVSTEVVDERNLGQQVQSLFNDHGGAEQLLQQCAEITRY
jgi:hypothetical protein